MKLSNVTGFTGLALFGIGLAGAAAECVPAFVRHFDFARMWPVLAMLAALVCIQATVLLLRRGR